jgi:hypothetical protein
VNAVSGHKELDTDGNVHKDIIESLCRALEIDLLRAERYGARNGVDAAESPAQARALDSFKLAKSFDDLYFASAGREWNAHTLVVAVLRGGLRFYETLIVLMSSRATAKEAAEKGMFFFVSGWRPVFAFLPPFSLKLYIFVRYFIPVNLQVGTLLSSIDQPSRIQVCN